MYRDVVVAKEWGLTPEEFWDKSSVDQALMIAFIETSNHMQSFEQEVARRK